LPLPQPTPMGIYTVTLVDNEGSNRIVLSTRYQRGRMDTCRQLLHRRRLAVLSTSSASRRPGRHAGSSFGRGPRTSSGRAPRADPLERCCFLDWTSHRECSPNILHSWDAGHPDLDTARIATWPLPGSFHPHLPASHRPGRHADSSSGRGPRRSCPSDRAPRGGRGAHPGCGCLSC
jgi:hypothetical protein